MATITVTIYWHYVFSTRRRTGYKKYYKNSVRISYHCWTESMVSSLVDLQEGELIPKYLYVSNSNKRVNRKDEELLIIWPYYSGF